MNKKPLDFDTEVWPKYQKERQYKRAMAELIKHNIEPKYADNILKSSARGAYSILLPTPG